MKLPIKKYLEINRDNIGICFDSDVGYYHWYRIGDVIELDIDVDGVFMLYGYKGNYDNVDGVGLWRYEVNFHIDYENIASGRLPIGRLIESGHIIDISRDILIDQILN